MNLEILRKAFDKARDNGWDFEGFTVFIRGNGRIEVDIEGSEPYSIYEVIYSHDFAKALWGTEAKEIYTVWVKPSKDTVRQLGTVAAYKHHLQLMVVAEDPIKYLGEHING